MAKSRKKDTPFSSSDTVTMTAILISVLIIAIWGILDSSDEPENTYISTPESENTYVDGRYDLIPCPTIFSEEVAKASQKYGIEKERLYAVMRVESNFNPNVVSKANARGLMQMIPSTYKEICEDRDMEYRVEDLFDPAVSIDFGAYYLKWLYDSLGDWDLAHMAYNAGINNVWKWLENSEYCQNGKITYIPFTETRNYMEKLNYYYNEYKN